MTIPPTCGACMREKYTTDHAQSCHRINESHSKASTALLFEWLFLYDAFTRTFLRELHCVLLVRSGRVELPLSAPEANVLSTGLRAHRESIL